LKRSFDCKNCAANFENKKDLLNHTHNCNAKKSNRKSIKELNGNSEEKFQKIPPENQTESISCKKINQVKSIPRSKTKRDRIIPSNICVENMEKDNIWNIKSWDEFCFYACPECNYMEQDHNTLCDHQPTVNESYKSLCDGSENEMNIESYTVELDKDSYRNGRNTPTLIFQNLKPVEI
jgi:signal recognition particle subunit SEC65